ncbi:MAG: OmpA family protein [Aquificaceae bacterium]
MRKSVLVLSLLSGLALAQEQKPLDPCGSPKEIYSKYLLDKCYKGYFDAIVESKRAAEEASKKVSDLEGRVKKLEGIADDHERRIRDLEGRPAPTAPKKEEGVGPYRWQLEEVGVVHFDFDKFNIRTSEAKKLDEMVDKLKGDSREVLVVGFADTRGTSRYNFNLSMWRAQMLASYLAKKGVDIGRIRIASYGKEVAELISPKHVEQRAARVYLIK